MMTQSHNIYAVITGDVIGSSELAGYGEPLDEVLEEFSVDFRTVLPLKVDRYAGDRFQALLDNQGLSLRGALYIFTKLASLKTSIPVRISIGLGGIKGVPKNRVSTGEGEAFRLSGSHIDRMKKYQRISVKLSEEDFGQERVGLLQGAMDLLSGLLMKLTRAQAEVIWYRLKGFTQEEIAQTTDRKQQSVSDISIAGYWRNIESFLEAFEGEFRNNSQYR